MLNGWVFDTAVGHDGEVQCAIVEYFMLRFFFHREVNKRSLDSWHSTSSTNAHTHTLTTRTPTHIPPSHYSRSDIGGENFVR